MDTGRSCVLVAALAAVVLFPAERGAADTSLTTIDVNSVKDLVDFDLGDGVCDADPAPGDAVVTLRAAIQNANQAGQQVTVNVPAGTYRLTLKGANENESATGDLDITGDVRVIGAGAATTIIDAKKAKDRVFDVKPEAIAEIANVTIQNGRTPKDDSGGGIRNDGTLTASRCIVAKCKADDDAGGIDCNGESGTLQHVVIRDCKAKDDGGGIDTDGSNMSILACAFVRNKAGSSGGGMEISGGTVSLQACTFSANKTKEDGGAVAVEDGGILSMDTCTLAKNRARTGGGLSNQSSEVTIVNDVFWKNRKGNCDGAVESQGGNVSDDESCSPGVDDLSETNALLAPLADNGGATLTHALLPGSPAATSGVNCGTGVDGRGVERPAGTCASGAFQPE